jgi:hypothetical protein
MSKTNDQKFTRDIVTRWGGRRELFDDGFVAIPSRFMEYRAAMMPHRLTPTEALFIIDLMAHKWTAADPYPGYRRLAKRMGKTEGYVRKLARALEIKGFLTRVPRVGSTNEFDLEPLFKKLSEHVRNPVKPPRRKATKRSKRMKAGAGPK